MSYALGQGTGPLRGVRVVEIAGIGPGPHAATLLADLGADVIRVERPGGAISPGTRETDLLTRGRPSVALDLKRPEAVEARARRWSRTPTCCSRACAPAPPSGSASAPTTAWPATRGWSTGG